MMKSTQAHTRGHLTESLRGSSPLSVYYIEFQHRPESRVLSIRQSLNIHVPSQYQDRRQLSSSPYGQLPAHLLFSQNPVLTVTQGESGEGSGSALCLGKVIRE